MADETLEIRVSAPFDQLSGDDEDIAAALTPTVVMAMPSRNDAHFGAARTN